jgi:dihydroxyacetone kinase-like predicted kinase
LRTIGPEEGDVLTIYYGQDIEEEQAQAFLKAVKEHFPDCEVELYYGGQPLYYYIMSIE